MSIKSALSELFKSEAPVAESAAEHLAHPTLTSTRFWVTIGFGAALIWLAHGVMTETNMILLTVTVNVYMICNTVTRWKQLDRNGDVVAAKAAEKV